MKEFTKLIESGEGIKIEVKANQDEEEQISSGFVNKIDKKFNAMIGDVIQKVTNPIVNSVQNIDNAINVEKMEIEFGFSFEGGGTVYLVNTKGKASVSVKLTIQLQK